MSYRVSHLKPLKRPKVTKKPFATADIEAHDWSQFRVIGYYDGKEFRHFLSLHHFFLHSFKKLKDKNIEEVWVHFGGIYDFMFLIDEAIKSSRFKISEMMPRGSSFLLIKVLDTKTNREIVFRDSSAILPFGLAKITESFGVEHKKQKFDVSSIDEVTEELIDYLKDDCRGLYESIKAYEEWDLIKEVGVQATMASQALKVFRLYLDTEIKNLTDKEDAFIRPSYFGGRTEIFKPFYNNSKKPLYCYDVNSLYPTVMAEEEFPIAPTYYTDIYKENELGFYDCTVEVPKMYIPPLPFVHPKEVKLLFPTGVFRGMWTTLELNYARSLGVKILKVHNGVVCKSGGKIFEGYITSLYQKRLLAISHNDGVGNILCKLLMNSCYGRFGLNKDRHEIYFDDGGSGGTPWRELQLENNKSIYLMKEDKRLDDTFTNVGIASWVTSASRVKMHKLFMKAGPESVYYTDTDSIFTTTEMDCGEGLGELKKEYESNRAIFLLPKTYLAEGVDYKKIAMKGFSNRKIQHFTFEDFEMALEGDLKMLKVIHDEKLATFSTSVKRFNKVLTKLPKSPKGIKSTYDKRDIFKGKNGYDSRPLNVNIA